MSGFAGWRDYQGPTKDSAPVVGKRPVNKYHAQKTVVHGVLFDSKKEAARYTELMQMGAAGLIADLELQPTFPLIVNGQTIAACRADFGYRELPTEQQRYEDTKGLDNPMSRLKRKFVKAQYGVEIRIL